MFESHFQTFEEPESGVALTARLSTFRDELARLKLTGFVIPRADQQQNEYVAPSEERLAWLTGFTGSAGLAIVLAQEAALFVDGRYTLQAAQQAPAALYEIHHLMTEPYGLWLKTVLPKGSRVGYDPWLHAAAAIQTLKSDLASAGIETVALAANPIDAVWPDRPAPPLAPAVPHGLDYAGVASHRIARRRLASGGPPKP